MTARGLRGATWWVGRSRAAWVAGLFGGAALVTMLPQAATAGDWKLTESTTFGLTQVDRTGNNESSGLVVQASPNIRLVGRGGRVSGDINLRPTFSVGGGSTDPRFFTSQGTATARMEVVEDVFFLGANAAARFYNNSGSAGSVDAINVDTDGGQSYSVGLTPEFRFHLNRYADLVSNNSINYVTYNDRDLNPGSDSASTRLHIGARNGRHFGPLSWRADASSEKTRYDDRDDTRNNVSAGVGYRINNTWAVNGNIGYEDNDVQTSRSGTNGATWDLGANWTPNPRNSASFSYGDRYFGETYTGRYTHISRRSTLSLSLSRDVENLRNQQLVDSFFFLADNQGNPVLDPQTGDPIIVNVPQLQETDEDFINTQLRAAVSVSGRRTTVNATGTVYQREYEVSNNDEDGYAFSLSVSRELGARYRATLASNYEFFKNTSRSDSDYYDVRFSLSRQLGRRSNAAINLSHHERDADNTADSYTENRLGVTLTTSFL